MRVEPDLTGSGVPAAPASSPAQTRLQIIRAAQEVFGRSGYTGGRTMDIATAARVTERTVFRHFATKAELFIVAVVEPFHAYIKSFVDEWNQREHGVRSAWDETYNFYAGLFDLLDAHRGLVVALIAAREFEDPEGTTFPTLASAMADTLTTAEPTLATESEARGFRGVPAVNVRFMFGLAMTVVIHGDWLFARADQPSRAVMLEEITAFTLNGFGAGPNS